MSNTFDPQLARQVLPGLMRDLDSTLLRTEGYPWGVRRLGKLLLLLPSLTVVGIGWYWRRAGCIGRVGCWPGGP